MQAEAVGAGGASAPRAGIGYYRRPAQGWRHAVGLFCLAAPAKTRISLQIVEKLTPPRKLSIVLWSFHCPGGTDSAAEYLQHSKTRLDILAVLLG